MDDLVEKFNFIQGNNVYTYKLVMIIVSGCNFKAYFI